MLYKYLRPGDSVDDSGMGDSVGGLEVVVSVGIFMHTPSLHFSSGPQSVLAFSHSFWKIKYSRESPSYVALICRRVCLKLIFLAYRWIYTCC